MDNLRDKKILLVDDEQDVLDLLKTWLVKNGFRNVFMVKNGEDAIKICREEKPHIVVLDIMLPDMDGYGVCREIRNFSNVPILFLSAMSDEADRVASFVAGGDDYVAKPFSPKEVVYRIKSNLGRLSVRNVWEDKDTIEVGDLVVRPHEHVLLKRGEKINLNPMEYDLFMCFLKNRNFVLSKEYLVEAALGHEYNGNDNNIMVQISRLRKKIEDNASEPKYIQTIKKAGYKFVDKLNT